MSKPPMSYAEELMSTDNLKISYMEAYRQSQRHIYSHLWQDTTLRLHRILLWRGVSQSDIRALNRQAEKDAQS